MQWATRRSSVIISASFSADIPAFYGRWFMKRLDAGYCRTFDSHGLKFHRVALTRESVDGFVFWTRNVGPFLSQLAEIWRRGFPFIIHYGISGRSHGLRSISGKATPAVRHMHMLASAYGSRCVVWRYEPIAVTSATSLEWHLSAFGALARKLKGTTDEVVVSFAEADSESSRCLMRSTPSADERAAQIEERRAFLKQVVAAAGTHGMRLSICSQPDYLVPGAAPARCIEAKRLSDVACRAIAVETRGNRPGCLCAAAQDIGGQLEHESIWRFAWHGTAAISRRRTHNPDSEFLFPPPAHFAQVGGADLPF